MSNVVTSQPRTTAKNNSAEQPSSEIKYETRHENYQQDDDQCCFVYFYSLYCSRLRCSGCCDDEKQKRPQRPPRRVYKNKHTSDASFDDDINTECFLNDENTQNIYNKSPEIHKQSDPSKGDLLDRDTSYDNNRCEDNSRAVLLAGTVLSIESTIAAIKSRNGDHSAGVGNSGGDRGHCSSRGLYEGVGHSDGTNNNGSHSGGLCLSDGNSKDGKNLAGDSDCYSALWGSGHHSGGHTGSEDQSGRHSGDREHSKGHSGGREHSGHSGRGDHSGGHSGGGDRSEGHSGGGDYSRGHSGGGDHSGGHSGGGDHSGGRDHSGGHSDGGDHSGGYLCGGEDSGGYSGGGDQSSSWGDSGGGDTGGDCGNAYD